MGKEDPGKGVWCWSSEPVLWPPTRDEGKQMILAESWTLVLDSQEGKSQKGKNLQMFCSLPRTVPGV